MLKLRFGGAGGKTVARALDSIRGRKRPVSDALDAEVIVAGGGPCGLMLANELGRRGVRILLLTEKTATSDFPQANASQARSMEHYRRLGLTASIRALGLPPDYPTDVTYWTRFSKHELARYRLPASGEAGKLVQTLTDSWSAAELPHRCSQMYVERVLREAADKLPSVKLQFGWRVTGFKDLGARVEVEAAPAAGDRRGASPAPISSAATGRAAKSARRWASASPAKAGWRATTWAARSTRSISARTSCSRGSPGPRPGNTSPSTASAAAW